MEEIKGNLVKFELEEKDAELFKKFMKHFDIWKNVFKIKGGRAILHFDKEGNLKKAEYNYQSFID